MLPVSFFQSCHVIIVLSLLHSLLHRMRHLHDYRRKHCCTACFVFLIFNIQRNNNFVPVTNLSYLYESGVKYFAGDIGEPAAMQYSLRLTNTN